MCLFIKILAVRFLFMNHLLISFVEFSTELLVFLNSESCFYIKEITTVTIICCDFFPRFFYCLFVFVFSPCLRFFLLFYEFILL